MKLTKRRLLSILRRHRRIWAPAGFLLNSRETVILETLVLSVVRSLPEPEQQKFCAQVHRIRAPRRSVTDLLDHCIKTVEMKHQRPSGRPVIVSDAASLKD